MITTFPLVSTRRNDDRNEKPQSRLQVERQREGGGTKNRLSRGSLRHGQTPPDGGFGQTVYLANHLASFSKPPLESCRAPVAGLLLVVLRLSGVSRQLMQSHGEDQGRGPRDGRTCAREKQGNGRRVSACTPPQSMAALQLPSSCPPVEGVPWLVATPRTKTVPQIPQTDALHHAGRGPGRGLQAWEGGSIALLHLHARTARKNSDVCRSDGHWTPICPPTDACISSHLIWPASYPRSGETEPYMSSNPYQSFPPPPPSPSVEWQLLVPPLLSYRHVDEPTVGPTPARRLFSFLSMAMTSSRRAWPFFHYKRALPVARVTNRCQLIQPPPPPPSSQPPGFLFLSYV